MYRAILFDLDDTLIGSTAIYEVVYRRLGLDLELLKTAKSDVKTRMPSKHVSSHNRLLYFKRYLELQDTFTPEATLNLMSRYEELLVSETKASWKAMRRDSLIKELSNRFVLGLVTNETTRTQLLKLSALEDSQSHFKFVITSEEVGTEKPSKAIFEEAKSRISDFKPSEILFVGDSVENDLIPSIDLGFIAVGTKEFHDESALLPTLPWLRSADEIMSIVGSV